MHSQVIQLYMYLFFSISYLFTSLGFFFSFAGQKLLVGLVPCCLFLLYCQCFAYSQLLFGKVVKNIQWRKDSLFNKSSWEHWISTCKRIKSHLFLQHAQVSTQDRYRPEHKTWNCKTPRRKPRGETSWHGFGNDFMNVISNHRQTGVSWGSRTSSSIWMTSIPAALV